MNVGIIIDLFSTSFVLGQLGMRAAKDDYTDLSNLQFSHDARNTVLSCSPNVFAHTLDPVAQLINARVPIA